MVKREFFFCLDWGQRIPEAANCWPPQGSSEPDSRGLWSAVGVIQTGPICTEACRYSDQLPREGKLDLYMLSVFLLYNNCFVFLLKLPDSHKKTDISITGIVQICLICMAGMCFLKIQIKQQKEKFHYQNQLGSSSPKHTRQFLDALIFSLCPLGYSNWWHHFCAHLQLFL